MRGPHVIGGIFDRVYPLGSLGKDTLADVQTVGVPAGGSAVVEMTLAEPRRYVLVDHALSRVERGAAGFLDVEGPADAEVFRTN